MEIWFCMWISQYQLPSGKNCITTLLSHWWNGPVVKSMANKSQLFRLSITQARKKSGANHLCNLVWIASLQQAGLPSESISAQFLPLDGWAGLTSHCALCSLSNTLITCFLSGIATRRKLYKQRFDNVFWFKIHLILLVESLHTTPLYNI